MARLPQSVTLRSTGNISAEGSVYKNKAGHTWNSKLFVIFPAESTAAHSLHFNIFLWTEVISLRRLLFHSWNFPLL
jgi:hypothetical protein